MSLQHLVETMTTDFAAAVAAEEKLHVAQIDDIQSQMMAAMQTRAQAMAQVRRQREEAAEIIAETLREEERIEQSFAAATRGIHDEFAKLRGTKSLGTQKLKVIGGKQ